MAGRQYQNVSYGLNQPLNLENPTPVIAKRNPTNSDFAFPTTIWTNTTTNAIYILASITNNSANWVLLEVGGGAGVFASLTVIPGPISLTGTTSINTAGAAVTSIGSGGTGAVNIGNTTGNTLVTGTLSSTGTITSVNGAVSANTTITAGTGISTAGGNISAPTGAMSAGTTITAGTGITATTGNIVASTGNITATLGNVSAAAGNVTLGAAAGKVVFANGISIGSGNADPNGIVTAPLGSFYVVSSGSGVANRAWINTDSGTTWTAIATAG
jgi:hypothetical protein